MSEVLWLRWRWTLVCGAAVSLALVGLVANGNLWELLGVFHMRPYFADLAAILAAGQAQEAGLNIYESNPYDPFGRPHVYGPLWLLTGKLGWVASDAWWLGLLLNGIFLVVALGLLAPRNPRTALVVSLVLLSPPILLAIERANNDLIVFVLLAVGALAASRPGPARGFIGGSLIVLSAALKFYSLVALPGLFARKGSLRLAAVLAATGIAVFTAHWWLHREAFAQAMSISPRPSTIFAYGLPLLPVAWELAPNHRVWMMIGGLVGGFSAVGLLWGHRSELWHSLPVIGGRTIAAVAGGMSWMFCFFATTNFPYRAVLLLLVLPWWLSLGSNESAAPGSRLGRRLCALFVGALWLAAPKYWFAGISLGLDEQADRGAKWLMLIVGVDQMLWLVLTLAIGVGLTGWAWRRWRRGTTE